MTVKDTFYEDFWKDKGYTLSYALSHVSEFRYPSIKTLWGNFEKPKKVLDFGCGNGVLPFWLAKSGFADSVLGVDVSETAIRFAKNEFTSSRLQYEHINDIADVAKRDNYDLVVSSHVLEHIKELEPVFSKLKELSSFFIFEVPLEKCLSQKLRKFFTGASWEDNPVGHVNFWNRDQFLTLLEQHGFVVAKEHLYAPILPAKQGTLRGYLQLALLKLLGVHLYSRIAGTHIAVLCYVSVKGEQLHQQAA